MRHLTKFSAASPQSAVYFKLCDVCRLVIDTNTAGFMSQKGCTLNKEKAPGEKNDPAERWKQKQARHTGPPFPGSLAIMVKKCKLTLLSKPFDRPNKNTQTVFEYVIFVWAHRWNWLQPVHLLISAKRFLLWVNFLDYNRDYVAFHWNFRIALMKWEYLLSNSNVD